MTPATDPKLSSLADLCSEVKRVLGSAQRLLGPAEVHKPVIKGAVIASNQTALEQDKNRFSTAGALATSDLHNSAHYDGQAVGVNASVGNDAGKFGVKGGADSSILVRGSDIAAGQEATLAAEGDIRLCVWCLISSLRPKAFQSHRQQPSRPWCWGRFLLGRPTAHWACRRS